MHERSAYRWVAAVNLRRLRVGARDEVDRQESHPCGCFKRRERFPDRLDQGAAVVRPHGNIAVEGAPSAVAGGIDNDVAPADRLGARRLLLQKLLV